MRKLAQLLEHTIQPSNSEEQNSNIGAVFDRLISRSGFSPDALCSGGRCFEFRDHAYNVLRKMGFDIHKTSSIDWIRGDNEKLGNTGSKWAEDTALEDNPHAWIFYNGKHYDALNPHGVSTPGDMVFLKMILTDSGLMKKHYGMNT